MSGGLDGQLQLNVKQRCKNTVECNCRHGLPNLVVKEENPVSEAKDFISCTHERTNKESFLLQSYLGGGDNRLQTNLENVTSVTVYYWSKVPDHPLFLKVIRSGGGSEEYYYKYAADEPEATEDPTLWRYSNHGPTLQQRLDDRNCGINGPTVFDLTNNYSGSPPAGAGATKSTCTKTTRTITKSESQVTPPQNYTIKEYTVGGQGTRISRVTYGAKNTNGITPPEDPVSTIRVYSWAWDTSIPLLIEFVKSNGRGSTWFANTSQKNTHWTDISTESSGFYVGTIPKPTQALTTKLEEVNCNVNHVVQIDVLKKGGSTEPTYCHAHNTDGHASRKRISVQDVTETIYPANKLFNYRVYEHIPNPEAYTDEPSPHKFIVSKFLKGTEKLNGIVPSRHLRDVEKILVYFCPLKSSEPLLIYYLSGGNHKWYKNSSGNTWTSAGLPTTTSPSSNSDKILEQLDQIRSPCQVPSVTIDIKFWLKEDENTYDSHDSSGARKGFIEVTSTQVPDTTDYKSFTHTVKDNTRDYFTVERVEYDKNNIPNISGIEKVKEFSVYYWKHHPGKTNPLLIKILKDGGSEAEWYENTSTDRTNTTWTPIISYKTQLAEPSKLKSKLTLLNCKLNNVTVIDIGKKPESKYCHQGDINIKEESHDPIIQVTDASKNPTYNGNIGKFVVYKHSLTEEARQKAHLGDKFHISNFLKDGNPIQLTESPLPFLNVTKFLVFWCGSGPNAESLLFYVEHNDTSKDWFKKPKNDNDPWIKLKGGELPRTDRDTKKIWDIINSYSTPCQDNTKKILICTGSVLAGGAGTAGLGYGIYEAVNWLTRPWWRLM